MRVVRLIAGGADIERVADASADAPEHGLACTSARTQSNAGVSVYDDPQAAWRVALTRFLAENIAVKAGGWERDGIVCLGLKRSIPQLRNESLRFGDIGIAAGRVIGIQLRNAAIVECGRVAWIELYRLVQIVDRRLVRQAR